MSKEAMKLALEALDRHQSIIGLTNNNQDVEAIIALRKALAEQPAQCAPAEDGVSEALDCPNHKPAQQEPLIWGVDWGMAGDIPCVSVIKRLPDGRIEVMAVEYAPYEYNPPAQRQARSADTWVHATAWRGLTDKEIDSLDCLYLNWLDYEQVEINGDKEFARAIEAKLKEKNCG